MPPDSDQFFWKRKLAAFLHDPPSKALDIHTHNERSEKAMSAAGLGTPEERRAWARSADHTAAAADRFPFPSYRKTNLSCHFDGVRNRFRHPLGDIGGRSLTLPFGGPFIDPAEAIEGEQTTQPILKKEPALDDWEQWRANFLAHWRLWRRASVSKDWRLGFLPADTRIPDHSIWSHMAVVSALEGCTAESGALQPTFLKFQLGPVQDFIQAARSTRDLWSGSYLISWLMAHGLTALSLQAGPDSVIFPSLVDQPLIDLMHKHAVWDRVHIGTAPIWDSFDWSKPDLLTPNLPNVFLAVVPAAQAEALAKQVEEAIQAEWHRIAESVWDGCAKEGLWDLDDGLLPLAARRDRFDQQIASFLSLSWSATPWPKDIAAAEEMAKNIPDRKVLESFKVVREAAEEIQKLGHGDERYCTRGQPPHLNNCGIAWSILVALSSWELDAVRQTRAFAAAPQSHRHGRSNTKDYLTGKDEAIAGGSAWKNKETALALRLKHDDYLSASSLVKRLWDKTYLHGRAWRNELGERPYPMPNTKDLAGHHPDEDSADDDISAAGGDTYFAVLAFDGDEMGKWVSGEKTPPFRSQLADYDDGGSLKYFERPEHSAQFAAFTSDKNHRPLSPGYHLQFSEALSNFALRCARPIVEAHAGRLIYAGGDDVVAMLPADTALACANDLQKAFRGEAPEHADSGIQQKSSGFLTSKAYLGDRNIPIPFMVPGPATTASVGIAIAHFKSPLQDAVRQAQLAEKRAKNTHGRGAVAVTVIKRSGETVEWGAKWADSGVQAAFALLEALQKNQVSGKFPYRLGALINLYRSSSSNLMKPLNPVPGFHLGEIFAKELAVVLARQQGPAWSEGGEAFKQAFTKHTEDWIQSLLQDPAPTTGEAPLSPAAAKTAASKRINHAIAQLTAFCAFCGFAKRLQD